VLEILNTAPSWLPGDDYYTNFHVGDPYIKVDQGFARLSGAGYAALHPELKDVDPEDYPDIHKMAILADVAPYSREYHNIRQRVAQQAKGDTELEIEYEKIMNRVKQTRESVIRMTRCPRPAGHKTPRAPAPEAAAVATHMPASLTGPLTGPPPPAAAMFPVPMPAVNWA